MQNSFLSNIPPVTKNLIIINFILWLASVALAARGIDINSTFGLHYWEADNFYPFQPLTYMFLHGSFGHVFFNMFALFMFGSMIEQAWGSKRFLVYYLICGIGAGLVQMLVYHIQIQAVQANLSAEMIQTVRLEGAQILAKGMNYTNEIMAKFNILLNTETIGASGSVFGLLLAFAIMFPNIPLYIMFIPIPIKAKFVVIGYGLLEFFFGILNKSGDNIAHFAHLGGMLFGLILILLWRKKFRNTDNF